MIMRKKSVILILATVFSVIPNFQFHATAAACTGTIGTDGAFTLMKFSAAQSICTWLVPAGINTLGTVPTGTGISSTTATPVSIVVSNRSGGRS